jgi:hypothetical protein
MKTKRKIIFFEITRSQSSVTNSVITDKECIQAVFRQFHQLNQAADPSIDMNAGRDTTIHILPLREIDTELVVIDAKARFIKYNDFPDTIKRSDRTEKSLGDEAEADEGIPEETHLVIDTRYSPMIIAVETSQSGPKINYIMKYINYWLQRIEISVEFEAMSIIGMESQRFIDSISECASLAMKVRKENIPNIKETDNDLGTRLEVSQQYADTDYVDLDLGYNFRIAEFRRSNTDKLINKVKRIFDISRRNPDFFDNFDYLQIRAQEGDEPLRVFDLIADRVASEVYAEKKAPRSKYFNSHFLCYEIKEEIGKNFGTP